MSLHPTIIPAIPAETVRVAKAAFRKGHLYLTIGDQIGLLFIEADFADLYAADGQPAISPVVLALVTIFQFMEQLSDREAADAVRGRIEWKYALHLPLEDAGFDFSVLADFRQRLVEHEAGRWVFERVLARLVELELLKKGGKQRTDATYVLSAVRDLNRVELVAETMRLALEAVAAVNPEWLRGIALAHWYERYNRILTSFRLPRGKEKQQELAMAIAADGFYLLDQVQQADQPATLSQLAEIGWLAQVWQQQFYQEPGGIRWRTAREMPPGAEQIASPHDVEARHTARKNRSWTGYQVHLTETCDPAAPHLITDVQTQPATTAEITVLPDIQQALAERDLRPADQLVDGGYVAGHSLVTSQTQYGWNLIGPVADDTSWQAHFPDGFTADRFQLDWLNQQAICPEGHTSISWSEATNEYGHPVVHIQFAKLGCLTCPARSRCTQATATGRTLHLSRYVEAIRQRRQDQQTDDFKAQYSLRAGIEGTISVAVRAYGARRSRYIGLSKTSLQELIMASAMNIKRAATWLMGDRPKGTRPPGLACLAPG